MKILLAIDGSEFSNAAVDQVATRSWPADSELRIITAEQPTLPASSTLWAAPTETIARLMDAAHKWATGLLIKATERIRELGTQPPNITTAVLKGDPKEAILDEASRWGADLIVIGSRGHGTFKRLMLGSVALAVASHAPCSVEIVRVRDKQTN